ncbi:MAG: iron-sulfur cluster assembly scaffold protein [Chloroflexota bacterium]|nr:iron-sulfur cluster assembly scaffold protein [Chloroflexota bacterium]
MDQETNSDFDQLQAELQEMVLDDVRDIYSETVIDHAMNPRNVGEMPDADGCGHSLGSCGDDMEIWLRVRNGNITEAKFWTNGCSTSIASGSMVTEMAKGRPVTEALKIGQHDVLTALDGLPEESDHCAQLAANALKEAIKNYLALKREPWKKAYRQP